MTAPYLYLIDLSDNNHHPVDFHAAKLGKVMQPQGPRIPLTGAIIKATESNDYDNPTFQQDWDACKAAGIDRMAYHFARPAANDPLTEAARFLHKVGGLDTYEGCALDVEDGAGIVSDLSAWALAWLQDVEHALGATPLLYCNSYYALNFLTDARLAHYPLWLAYPNAPQCPARMGIWPEVTVWQNSWTAQWPGIRGDVDLNVCARTLEDFRKLGKQPAPAPPVPPPTKHKYRVLIDMRCRPTPDYNASFWPPQYAYRGATLDGTGQVSGDWTQVVAGGRACWLLSANLQAV